MRSSAPSYVSAAPSYHSRSAAVETSGTSSSSSSSGLLSSQHSAPGFRRLGPPRTLNTLTDSHLRSLYNVAEWVPATEGLQARHYHNIATRRATESSRAMALARTVFPLLNSPIQEACATVRDPSEHDVTECSAAGSSRLEENQTWLLIQDANGSTTGNSVDAAVDNNTEVGTYTSNVPDTSLDGSNDNPPQGNVPLSPHEDPHLVGEAAAARFRSQRLYISYQQQENQSAQLRRLSEITGRPRQSLSSSSQPSVPLAPPLERSLDQEVSLDSQPGCVSNGSASAGPTGRLGRHRATACQGADEALKQEAKTWDFMIVQMSDWKRREQSWKKFRDEVDERFGAGILGGSCMRLGIKFGDRNLSRVKGEKVSSLGSNRKRFKKVLSGLFTSDGVGFDASGYST